jgi:hypothetical protein
MKAALKLSPRLPFSTWKARCREILLVSVDGEQTVVHFLVHET